MKKLVALISTQGKTKEQIAKEAIAAWKKYQKVRKKVNNKINSTLVWVLF